MKIAYLINQYPQASQSFIRREVAGLEALGFHVELFTLRTWDQPLVDPADPGHGRVQLLPRDRIPHALVRTSAHRLEDERAFQARKHDEDTGRRMLTLDHRELGWHHAQTSRIHDEDVGLSHGRLGKRVQIIDFNGRHLSAARAKNIR